MSSAELCIAKIIEASGGKLSRRDAGEMLRKFNEETKNMSAADRIGQIDTLLADFRENMVYRNEIYDIHAKKEELHNAIQVQRLITRIDGIMNDHQWSFQKSLDALFHSAPEMLDSLDKDIQGIRDHFNILLEVPILKDDLLSHFRDKDTLYQAVDYVFGDDGPHITPEAKKIGDILMNVKDVSYRRLNEAGAYVLDTPRIIFNTKAADATRVAGFGRDNFLAYCNDLLESGGLDRKFFLGMDRPDIDEYFLNLYDRMKGGNNFIAPAGSFDGGGGGLVKSKYRDLAKSSSMDYDLPFATADAYKSFIDKFSDQSLNTILVQRVGQIGRQVALLETLGPSPERALSEIINHYFEKMTPSEAATLAGVNKKIPGQVKSKEQILKDILTSPIKALDYVYGKGGRNPFNTLKVWDGTTSAPVNATWANVSAGAKTAVSLAKLSSGIFLQFPDLPIRMAMISKVASNPLESWLVPFKQIAGMLPTDAEQKLFYARMAVGAESWRHAIAESFGINASSSKLSRAADIGFSLNLMGKWDMAGRYHVMQFLSNEIPYAIDNPQYGKNMIDMLHNYGFTDAELSDLTTNFTSVAGDGSKYIDPEKLSAYPKMYEKYLGMAGDFRDTAVPYPRAGERSITTKGQRPGTIGGTVADMTMMFKSYPIMFMTRILPRIYFEHGNMGTAFVAAQMLTYWYIGDSLKALAEGRTPRDMTMANNMLDGMARSGFGGLYGDLLLSDFHSGSRTLTDAFAGPMFGVANDIASAATGLPRGELSGKEALRKTINLAPIPVPLVKSYLDRAMTHMFLETAYPGTTRQSQQSQYQRTGQQDIFNPVYKPE